MKKISNGDRTITISFKNEKSKVIRIVTRRELNELLIKILREQPNEYNFEEYYRTILSININLRVNDGVHLSRKESYEVSDLLGFHAECLLYFRLGQLYNYQYNDQHKLCCSNKETNYQLEKMVTLIFRELSSIETQEEDEFKRHRVNKIQKRILEHYEKMDINPPDSLRYILNNQSLHTMKKRIIYWLSGVIAPAANLKDIEESFRFKPNWYEEKRYLN